MPKARTHAAATRNRKPKTVAIVGTSVTGTVVAAVAAAAACITIAAGFTVATAATRGPQKVLDGVNGTFLSANLGQTVSDLILDGRIC